VGFNISTSSDAMRNLALSHCAANCTLRCCWCVYFSAWHRPRTCMHPYSVNQLMLSTGSNTYALASHAKLCCQHQLSGASQGPRGRIWRQSPTGCCHCCTFLCAADFSHGCLHHHHHQQQQQGAPAVSIPQMSCPILSPPTMPRRLVRALHTLASLQTRPL
jgi:hypothetical protein